MTARAARSEPRRRAGRRRAASGHPERRRPPPSAAPLRRGGHRAVEPTAPGRFDDAPFIRACRGLTVDHVPVWFMRQAGRSLPEYRAARGPGSILDAIAQPELVAELTRQPVDRYGTDAAIFFSDIVVPVAAIGFGVDVAPGTGPVVAEPFRAQGRPPAPPAPRARDRHALRRSRRWASWPASWTSP